jgi:hypothetical protein
MANTPTVLGNGPFEYTDPTSGKQVSIPLSALFFDPSNNNQLSINSTQWTPAVPAFVAKLLGNLAQQQIIVPVPVASPKPAMVITAKDPGSAGNNIQVVIAIASPNIDPTQVKFSVTVTETESYKRLSLNSTSNNYIETILGSDTVQSQSPGLVHVLHASLGATGTPATATPFKAASTNAKAQSDVKTADATPKTLFTLEAKKKGKDGELTSVISIGPNAGDPTTFDLSVQWTKQATNLTLANVQGNTAAALYYEVAVSAPPSGIFSIPAAGTVQLTGGTNGTSATAASAVIFAA